MLELVHNRVNAGFRHSLSRMKISGCDFSNSSHCKLPRAQAVFAMARPKGGSATLEICCELSELQITEQELRAETKEGGRNYIRASCHYQPITAILYTSRTGIVASVIQADSV
jgi:hypothetical protein